jgi:hypothetical protein
MKERLPEERESLPLDREATPLDPESRPVERASRPDVQEGPLQCAQRRYWIFGSLGP